MRSTNALATGTVLEMLSDDPAAIIDVPHFCAESGHELLEQRDVDDHQVFLIKKT